MWYCVVCVKKELINMVTHSVSSSMILCFSLISSRRRASCLWWRPRWESPCWRIFWKRKEQISLQRCQLQWWKLKSQLNKKKGGAHNVFEMILWSNGSQDTSHESNLSNKYFTCILFWVKGCTRQNFNRSSLTLFLTFTLPSSVSPFSPSFSSCTELSGKTEKTFTAELQP